MLMTMPNLQGEYGEASAMVGLWLDLDALNAQVASVSWENQLSWMIVDADGRVLNQPMETYASPDIDVSELTGAEQRIVQNGVRWIVQVAVSDKEDWKYVLLMPEAVLSKQAGHIRNAFFVGIVLCMCAGHAVALRMVRMNYSPLHNILELFKTQTGAAQEDTDNEYKYLEESAVSFFQERSSFQQKMERDRKVLRQYYLAGLLELPYDSSKDTPDRLAAAERFVRGKNLVLLLAAQESMGKEAEKAERLPSNPSDGEDSAKNAKEEAASLRSLKRFIVRNVFEEGMGAYFQLETVELGSTIAMILNLGSYEADYMPLLSATADSLQQFIHEHFGFSVVTLAGEPHEGLAGIHDSYAEARMAEGFVYMLDAEFVSYAEIKNRSFRHYDYTQDQETRIINALMAHNTAAAMSCINTILDTNFLEHKLSLDMGQCLLYDLAGTLMKASAETGFPGQSEADTKERWNLKELSVRQPLERIRSIFARMVEDVSGEEAVETGSRQNRQLCQDVLIYIQEHYSDPDLNISQTGQHFHLTPAYLSAIFRKETGWSLLKVITQIRIREAEKLLLDENISVVEVGMRVGFRDSSTFIRTFKKFTGLTPGQLRGKHGA